VGDDQSVELIRVLELGPAPYAYAAVAPDRSELVFTAGACPVDEHGEVVAVGDVAGQAERAVQNLRTALEAADVGLQHVVKTTIYVASTDRADLAAAWNAISHHFGEHDVPSTLLGVALLGYPDQLIEIEAIAVRPSVAVAGPRRSRPA
jgi:enamine deaminase RidA (YjgF/YER057c/UK114 family)